MGPSRPLTSTGNTGTKQQSRSRDVKRPPQGPKRKETRLNREVGGLPPPGRGVRGEGSYCVCSNTRDPRVGGFNTLPRSPPTRLTNSVYGLP